MIVIGADYDVLSEARKAGYTINGIVDPNVEGKYDGVEVLPNDEYIFDRSEEYKKEEFIISVDDEISRGEIYEEYKKRGFSFGIIDNSAEMRSRSFGEGCIFMEGSFVGKKAEIGTNVKLSYRSMVNHDVSIGNSCIVAPNANLLGYVDVGKNTYVGANSTVCPRVEIGSNVKVGAGSTVAEDTPNGVTVIGYYPVEDLSKIVPRI